MESSNNSYAPIMTDELPTPLALIELSVCSCKTNCCSNRCHKNTLICTDMCKYYVGCEIEDGDQSDEEVYLSDNDENINADDI